MRRVFNYDNFAQSSVVNSTELNVYNNNISACGCLIYKLVNGNVELLLIKYTDPRWNKLDDFGGQIDSTDKTVMDAMSREMFEETNGILVLKDILFKYAGSVKRFYNKKSKYYFYTVEVDDNFSLDNTVYGDSETLDNIGRTISWYNYKECKNSLSYRLLNCFELIKFLDNLVKNDFIK